MGKLKTSVLVVIPTLNEVRYIESVVEQLMAGLNNDICARFVISDGGSDDGTVEKILGIVGKYSNVDYIHNPKRIQSAAINCAVQRFGHGQQILIRCDAHASYPNEYILKLVNSLEASGADSVVVPMDSIGSSYLQRAIGWAADTPIGSGGAVHRGGRKSGFVDHGHHAAFRMEMFVKVGGYNESFSHNEDGEYDCRQRVQGARIYFDSGIRIGYYPRSSIRGIFRQYWAYGNGRSRTIKQHPNSLRLRQVLVPLNLMIIIFSIVFSVVSAWVLAWFVIYVSVLIMTGVFLVIQRRHICGFLAAPALFVMHNAWALGFLYGMIKNKDKRFRLIP